MQSNVAAYLLKHSSCCEHAYDAFKVAYIGSLLRFGRVSVWVCLNLKSQILMKCPGEPYQKGFPAAHTCARERSIMLISGDADGINAGADVIWQMGSVMPVYWGLSNRLVLVKCTLRRLCRVFIVPLRNTDSLLRASLHLFVQGKSIIRNDQISAALILSLYSVWHSLQLQDRESSRQCVLGTALF